MRAVVAAAAVLLQGFALTAFSAEIVDREAGFRLEVPRGWEGRVKGDRIELVDPIGEPTKDGLPIGTARMWARPIADPNFWFEQLLQRDDTRDVRRLPAKDGADGRFDYVDAQERGSGVDQNVSIICRQVAKRWICVVLETRIDDTDPGTHRSLHAKVVESLRPLEQPRTTQAKPDPTTSPGTNQRAPSFPAPAR